MPNKLLKRVTTHKYRSIFVKNSIIVVVLVIILVSSISAYIYQNANKVIIREVDNMNASALYKVSSVVDSIFDEANQLATHFSQQTDIQMFMMDNDINAIKEGKYNTAINRLKSFTLIYEYIDSIYVYGEGSNYIISTKENSPFSNFYDTTWIEDYNNSRDGISRTQPRKRGNIYPYFISFIKPFYISADKKVGCVVINIDIEELGKLIKSDEDKSLQNIYILDESNNIIYCDEAEKLFNEEFLKASKEKLLSGRYDDSVIVSNISSKISKWKYIGIIPRDFYAEKIQNSVKNVAGIIIAVLLAGITIAYLISIKTYEPIKKIISIFESGSRGEKEKAEDSMRELEEIKYISSYVYKALDDNKRLEEDLQGRLKLLNEAQAAALQAQINPHFLYNTLDNIRWMAFDLSGSNNEVTDSLSSLSQLMRVSLDMSNRIVPLSQEFEHARLYINILEVRYIDRLKVIWKIEEEIKECRVIKLMLQPIIENSMNHGLKTRRYNGEIEINGYIKGDCLIIAVTDDGVGMNEERVRTLNASMEDTNILHAEHIGLRNVNQRIKLVFGSRYGLRVESRENAGTKVELVLPVIKE